MTTTEIAAIAKLSEPAKALVGEDLSPSRYVELLENEKLFKDAVFFLVHGLPVAIGIRWACQCCHELLTPEQLEETKASLEAAEKWVSDPSEESRRAAKLAAQKDGIETAADLIGMGVFFSGGSVADPGAPELQPPPYLAQKMTANGIQIAVLSNAPEKVADRYQLAIRISRDVVKQAK